jgi:probable rRNA maturation factor
MGSIGIKATYRGKVPRIAFLRIARYILGDTYELSLVICGDSLAQRMNKEYRKKTYKPNVLSFPISKNEGEIFLNIPKAAREARQYRTTLEKRAALLFVHGCYHLKGLDHSDKMEALEQKTLRRFGY